MIISKTKRTQLFSLGMVFMAASFSVHGTELYDMNDVNVKGVTLGMNANDAIDHLIELYSLDVDKIKFRYEHGATERNIKMRMGYTHNDLSIVMWFQPDLAAKESGYTTVDSVSVNDRVSDRKEQLDEMIAKIGPPSVSIVIDEEKGTGSYLWCAKLSKSKKGCDYDAGQLDYTNHGIELVGNADESKAIVTEARSMMQELGVPGW